MSVGFEHYGRQFVSNPEADDSEEGESEIGEDEFADSESDELSQSPK